MGLYKGRRGYSNFSATHAAHSQKRGFEMMKKIQKEVIKKGTVILPRFDGSRSLTCLLTYVNS
jgi:hypothetical protein